MGYIYDINILPLIPIVMRIKVCRDNMVKYYTDT